MKLLCLFLVMTLTSAACGRPNFLLIVTDDQRWDTVGVNDPKVALATPHMDYKKIAAQVERLGVTWDDALNDPEIREAIGSATGWYY